MISEQDLRSHQEFQSRNERKTPQELKDAVNSLFKHPAYIQAVTKIITESSYSSAFRELQERKTVFFEHNGSRWKFTNYEDHKTIQRTKRYVRNENQLRQEQVLFENETSINITDEIDIDSRQYTWRKRHYFWEKIDEFKEGYAWNDERAKQEIMGIVADFNNPNPEVNQVEPNKTYIFDATLAPESEFIPLKVIKAKEAEEKYFADRRHWRISDFPK